MNSELEWMQERIIGAEKGDCEYCWMLRRKHRKGEHTMEHFSLWYQWWCKLGFSRLHYWGRVKWYGFLWWLSDVFQYPFHDLWKPSAHN